MKKNIIDNIVNKYHFIIYSGVPFIYIKQLKEYVRINLDTVHSKILLNYVPELKFIEPNEINKLINKIIKLNSSNILLEEKYIKINENILDLNYKKLIDKKNLNESYKHTVKIKPSIVKNENLKIFEQILNNYSDKDIKYFISILSNIYFFKCPQNILINTNIEGYKFIHFIVSKFINKYDYTVINNIEELTLDRIYGKHLILLNSKLIKNNYVKELLNRKLFSGKGKYIKKEYIYTGTIFIVNPIKNEVNIDRYIDAKIDISLKNININKVSVSIEDLNTKIIKYILTDKIKNQDNIIKFDERKIMKEWIENKIKKQLTLRRIPNKENLYLEYSLFAKSFGLSIENKSIFNINFKNINNKLNNLSKSLIKNVYTRM